MCYCPVFMFYTLSLAANGSHWPIVEDKRRSIVQGRLRRPRPASAPKAPKQLLRPSLEALLGSRIGFDFLSSRLKGFDFGLKRVDLSTKTTFWSRFWPKMDTFESQLYHFGKKWTIGICLSQPDTSLDWAAKSRL